MVAGSIKLDFKILDNRLLKSKNKSSNINTAQSKRNKKSKSKASLTKKRPKAKHLQRVTLITGGLGLDSTVAFPYPKTVGMKRRLGPGQRAHAVWLDRRRTPARFLSYWERNVVKDAAFDGGLTRVDKKMSCGGYASWSLYWGKHFRGKTADLQWRRLHRRSCTSSRA